MALSRDVSAEILKYVQNQGQFRRVNRMTSQLPILNCCSPPSNYEIATWLWDQSQLLSYLNTAQYSVLNPNSSTIVYFATRGEGGGGIWLDLKTGKLLPRNLRTPFRSRDELLNFLNAQPLELKFSFYRGSLVNWLMIRDILSLRASCVLAGFSSDECFIKLLADFLPTAGSESDYVGIQGSLGALFTDQVARRLFEDFNRVFGIDFNSPYLKIRPLDAQLYNAWLRSHLLALTPADLKLSNYINPANTNYS